jgi:hypothetical protein
MPLLPQDQNNSFFIAEELQRFKDLAKKHYGLDLTDEIAEDQFHRLFLQIEDIVMDTRNGTMDI